MSAGDDRAPVFVLHVHTRFSDGTGTPADVRAALAAAGVDGAWITDHDTLAARDDAAVGWQDGRLVLVGAEVTTRSGHLLVLGARTLLPAGWDGTEAARAYRALGAAVFAAHPRDAGNRLLRIGPYPWTGEADALSGVEVWNHLAQWGAARDGVGRLLAYGRRLWKGAERPDARALALWDRWGPRGVAAVAGVDAHGIRIGRGPWSVSVLSYAASFKTVWTQVFLDDPLSGRVDDDERRLVQALAQGRALMVAGRAGRPVAFRFRAEGPDGTAPMGAATAWRSGIVLVASVAAEVEWVWWADGRPVTTERGRTSRLAVARPGRFRVEAARLGARGTVPWIWSNAIRVGP